MVYCGRPSKACLPCRKRKLLCDLRKDGCSQCLRASLTCTGYRDTSALRIRDESAAVQRKVRTPQRIKPPKVQSLDLTISHQAKDIFYYNYVVGVAKPFDFLKPYYSHSPEDQHLVMAIDATSLAYLNYQKRCLKAAEEAQQSYVAALRLTNTAIRTPSTAAKDSTLLAILLLDLYEKITSKEPSYAGAWAAHVHGAFALVRLRGKDQFRNPTALRMLVRLSTNLLISCVASGYRVPHDLVELREYVAANSPDSSDPKWRESGLMVGLAELIHDLKKGTISDCKVLHTAFDLDAKFCSLSREIVTSWQYKTICVSGKSVHHFENFQHSYPGEHIAQMWNVLRLTRIMLNELIYAYSCKVHEAGSLLNIEHTTAALSNFQQMSSEVCASVPQYIGGVEVSDLSHISGNESYAERLRRARVADATQHLPCYRLIFPLFITARSRFATPELKKYAITQLKFMADFHAIENAALVAQLLETDDNQDPWLVYAKLGSYAFVC